MAQAAPAQADAAQIAGDYSGVVKVEFVLGGVYSDTLATPPPPAAGTPAPPDLGSNDLALSLSQTGNAVSGYVDLGETLIFTPEHTIQVNGSALKIGPYVSGTFDGQKLTLVSERVSTTFNGQSIQRQFRLTGAISQSDGSQLTGEYRETLWGVAHAPVTVIGAFTLQRPVFDDNVPNTSNKAPVTVADTATTAPGVAVTINVLANDSDANGDPLTITAVSKPQFGTAATNGKTITYTPKANFSGLDSFSYIVSDGKGGETAGFVTVTIGAPPIANTMHSTSRSFGAASRACARRRDVDPCVCSNTRWSQPRPSSKNPPSSQNLNSVPNCATSACAPSRSCTSSHSNACRTLSWSSCTMRSRTANGGPALFSVSFPVSSPAAQATTCA